MKSFNPCFPGSSAESNILLALQQLQAMVSILVFLDQALKDDYDASGRVRVTEFQSLFSWIKR